MHINLRRHLPTSVFTAGAGVTEAQVLMAATEEAATLLVLPAV